MREVFAFVVGLREREGVRTGATGEVVRGDAGGFVGYARYGEHVGASGTDWWGVSWCAGDRFDMGYAQRSMVADVPAEGTWRIEQLQCDDGACYHKKRSETPHGDSEIR